MPGAAMKLLTLFLVIAITCICSISAAAGKIYTWTDENGISHISEKPPPSNEKIDDVIEYTPRTTDEDRQTQEQRQQFIEQSNVQVEISQAERRAKRTRRRADEARAKAERAQAEADAAFQRSEEFKMKVSNTVRRWQKNKATRKKLEAEAATAYQNAQKAIQEADKMEKLAQEANSAAEEILNRQKKAASENPVSNRGIIDRND